MKRSIALAVVLAVSGMLLSLASSDSVSQAQQRRLFQWDTGVVSLGPNQVLRLVGDWNGDGDTTVGFREIMYGQGACNGTVCKLITISSTTSGPNRLAAGEAISLELVATTYGRGILTSNRRDLRVTAAIINTTTGEPLPTSSWRILRATFTRRDTTDEKNNLRGLLSQRGEFRSEFRCHSATWRQQTSD